MDATGHRQRLRARYLTGGLDSFAPHEVLELLLTFAIPRRDTKPLSYALLTRFGTLHAVLEASPEELCQVPGIGEGAATLLSLMAPMFRAYRKSLSEEKPVMITHQQTAAYCESLFEGERCERFYVIGLDARQRRLSTVCVSTGDVSRVTVPLRQVVSALLKISAVGTVLCHNHPGGTAMPSREDVLLTQRLFLLLQGVGIRLYDHLIIAPQESFSFARGGLLTQEALPAAVAQQDDALLLSVSDTAYRAGCTPKGEIIECADSLCESSPS